MDLIYTPSTPYALPVSYVEISNLKGMSLSSPLPAMSMFLPLRSTAHRYAEDTVRERIK